MTLHQLLDDVAAEATRDLRIDVAAVRERADRRRREMRRRAASVMATAVAVAATVVLVVTLFPGLAHRATDAGPAVTTTAPTGLPDRWFYAPPWTPPVTRHPMPAASMVLRGTLSTDFQWSTVPGPVLVSADGRSYASLPWGPDDRFVALSRDGRRVAWITQRTGRPTLHRIELATGEQRDAELPTKREVQQLVWAGDDLWAGVAYGTPGSSSTWKLPWSGDPVKACDCAASPLAADAPGRLVVPRVGAEVTGGTPIPALTGPIDLGDDYSDVTSGRAVVSPDGAEVAVAVDKNEDVGGDPDLWLAIDGPELRRFRFTGPERVDGAQVLGWAAGGIVVRVSSTGDLNPSRSLRLYDPARGSYRILSRPVSTSWQAVAVADDVVGAGGTVPGVRPQFSSTDRSHVRFLIGMVWSAYSTYVEAAVVALVLLFAGLLWWRRKTGARDEPAHAPGGPDPAADGG